MKEGRRGRPNGTSPPSSSSSSSSPSQSKTFADGHSARGFTFLLQQTAHRTVRFGAAMKKIEAPSFLYSVDDRTLSSEQQSKEEEEEKKKDNEIHFFNSKFNLFI